MKAENIHGVNAEAIGKGLWDMLSEDDRLPLTLGMAPAKIMEHTERMIRERIAVIKLNSLRIADPDPESIKLYAESCDKRQIGEIMRGVHLGLLSAAKEAGVLKV